MADILITNVLTEHTPTQEPAEGNEQQNLNLMILHFNNFKKEVSLDLF